MIAIVFIMVLSIGIYVVDRWELFDIYDNDNEDWD